LARVSVASGAVDNNWDPAVTGVPGIRSVEVLALALGPTNLFVGGSFTNVDGVPRGNLAKLRTSGTGSLVDTNWNPLSTNSPAPIVGTLALDGVLTHLYLGFCVNYDCGLVRASVDGRGALDGPFNPSPYGQCSSLLAVGEDVYVGGTFTNIGGAERNGFAFLPVADAPQLIQDTATNFFVFRNEADGPEVTHFQITGINGGNLYRSDGVTPLHIGDFITVADGGAGL